ncbi:hypothetical protein [Rhizobium sp. CIAT894]|uniref:hypothetical protein n=1 Tax=Rhizobium sp. CIAT894 TaxID=2020312 RepID=UPI0013DD9D88|nr:hypothetical protein [Rhizobium sp. CIAT894]
MLEHQTLVTGVLTVIAALGMIVQIRVSDHRNDKRPEGFMLRTPTAQTRRRDDEDDY